MSANAHSRPTQNHSPHVLPRLLGIAAAAAYLGATPWFIRSLIWNRAIPFCKLGKRLLLDKADLDAFVATQKEGAR